MSKKQALRGELISKVVKNEENKLKQLRIFSGGNKAPQTFIAQNQQGIPIVKQKGNKIKRTSSKVENYDKLGVKKPEQSTRNRSPFNTNINNDFIVQKGIKQSRVDLCKLSDDNQNTIFTITNNGKTFK